jgi:hypothetical protein
MQRCAGAERVLLFGRFPGIAFCLPGQSDAWMMVSVERWWSDIDRGKKSKVQRQKPVPMPLCPPQVSHGRTWDRTRASAMTGR